jgi:uncharacterized membrane protein HdeD (DUF308 family)
MTPEEQREGRYARATAPVRDLVGTAADDLFKRAWWAIAIRGVLAIVLGILMLAWPGITLAVAIAMLGVYMFFDGIFALVATFQSGSEGRSWWPYLLEGVLSIGVGLLAFARPTTMALAVLILIAVRSIIVGVVELGTGVSVRRATGTSTWMLWLGGLASIAFGILLLVKPGPGLLALVWIAGIYMIVFGLMLDTEAFRLRSVRHRFVEARAS